MKKVFLYFLLITFGIASSLFIGTKHLQRGTFGDSGFGFGCESIGFWELSKNIKNKGEYTNHPFITTTPLGDESSYVFDIGRLPAYPSYLAAARSIWDHVNVAYLLQILLYILACMYALLLAPLLYKNWNMFAFLLYAVTVVFSPLLLFYTYGVNCEILAAASILGFIYHLIKMQSSITSNNTVKLLFHIPLIFLYGATSFLTKSNLIVFTFPLLFLFMFLNTNGSCKKIIINASLLFSLIAALFVWGIVIYKNTGLKTISGLPGINIYTNYLYFSEKPECQKYKWTKELRQNFIDKEIKKGETNLPRLTKTADAQYKKQVIAYFIANPGKAFCTGIYTTTQLFTRGYFPPSDILLPLMFNMKRTESHFLEAYQMKKHGLLVFMVWKSIRIIWRIYNWLLLLSFFLFPLLFIRKKRFLKYITLLSIWTGCFIYIMSTGFIIGQNGDRHLITIYALVNMFLFISGIEIFKKLKINSFIN
jgi:hypothetical protein